MTKKEELSKKAEELNLPLEDESGKILTIAELEEAISNAEKEDENDEDNDDNDPGDSGNDTDGNTVIDASIDNANSTDGEPLIGEEERKPSDLAVIKLRQASQEIKKIKAELFEFKKNWVSKKEHDQLKANFDKKEKACADLRKEIVELKASKK